MSDKFSKAVDLAESSPANIENTLLIARSIQPEQRSRRAHTHLKPSEYDTFVSHIGRETVSNVVRELILEFNRRHHDANT